MQQLEIRQQFNSKIVNNFEKIARKSTQKNRQRYCLQRRKSLAIFENRLQR